MRTTDSRHDTTADTRPHRPERADSLDAALDALSDRRCRALLGSLAESDEETVVVEDLADRLVADDRLADRSTEDRLDEESVDGRTSHERAASRTNHEEDARLRARLHHVLLPKLDDADLLDYNADRGLVRRCPESDSAFDSVRSAIDAYEEDHADEVALDVLFDLLSAYRRRTAYRVLLRHDDLSLPDLADEVAVEESGTPLSKVDADRVLQVYLSLYHTHVPKLSDAGLVAYDQENDYVALTETGRVLESAVRRLVEAADA